MPQSLLNFHDIWQFGNEFDFIIKIICQWSDNADSRCPITLKSNFKSLKSDFYEQRYETFFIHGGHLGFMQIKRVSHGS